MGTPITFNELRRIKDMLPEGTMREIAHRLNIDVATGLHVEQGPDGGVVILDDPKILDMARKILKEQGKE